MRTVFFGVEDERFALVKQIRTVVFTNEQKASADEEFDRFDRIGEMTRYALVYEGKNAIATGRIAVTDYGYKIGRVAVLKSSRGNGAGVFLVNALIQKCIELGDGDIYVDAQMHAVKFYEKLGFKIISEKQIIDRSIAHLPMKFDMKEYNYGKEK